MNRTTDALPGALSAEHAAVYGYGVAGARLEGDDRETARLVMNAHRTRRDELAAHVSARGARPVAAAAAYRLPVRVSSAQTAARLAAALEDRVLAAYLGLAGADEPELRRYAAVAMQEAAGRAVAWRRTAGDPPDGAAFPALPPSALSPRR